MSRREDLEAEVRAARQRYDALRRGQSAPIRHCKTADDLAIEAIYWQVGGTLAHDKHDLAHVVLLFPLAPHRHGAGKGFSFGRFLRAKLGDSDGAALRFRRLLASDGHDELTHRLRGVLRLACADKSPVDWGVLGADILWFPRDNNIVRRRWVQDFYAPISTTASAPTP